MRENIKTRLRIIVPVDVLHSSLDPANSSVQNRLDLYSSSTVVWGFCVCRMLFYFLLHSYLKVLYSPPARGARSPSSVMSGLCCVRTRPVFQFRGRFFAEAVDFFFASISHHLKTSFAVHRITRTRGSLVSMCVCTKSTQSEYERAKKYTPHNGRLLPQTFLFLPPPKKAQSLSRPVRNHRMTEVCYKMRLTYSVSPCEVVRWELW